MEERHNGAFVASRRLAARHRQLTYILSFGVCVVFPRVPICSLGAGDPSGLAVLCLSQVWCDMCKCYMKNHLSAIRFHEQGENHKTNLAERESPATVASSLLFTHD